MLCRNETRLPPSELSKLKCRYVTNKSAFLKIAPLKLEEAHLKPYIVIYHDVMYEAEIDLIKKMAKPRVGRRMLLSRSFKLLTLIIVNSSNGLQFKTIKPAN